jgi:hypothetical protein
MKSVEFKETNWKRLLDEIENGQIIPIIGDELLVVSVNGKETLLYQWLARELASRLDVDYDQNTAINISGVIYEYQNKHGADPTQPYYEIYDLLRNAKFDIPESLKTLAQILPLKLFLTTTIDNYFEKALNEYRFNGENKTKSITFSKNGFVDDIPSSSTETIVYHMFGRSNTLSTYVATEEDLLEFCQKWHNPDRRPPILSSVLKEREKYYMLLGCNFSNWLARFFLYGVKSETLFDPNARRGVIADRDSKNDEALTIFLSRCNTILYNNGNAIEFITELGRRWKERLLERNEEKAESIHEKDNDQEGFIHDSIFISYASEDIETAKKISTALSNAGLDIWFDKYQLESGDFYEKKIEKNIQNSVFFIPILSKNTISYQRRFFQLEWHLAISEMRYRPAVIPFILPLAIDDTNENESLIPDEFKKLHWARINSENSLPEFVTFCKQRVRSVRLQKIN